MMWFLVSLPGAKWAGAPTLPREIVRAPPGSVTGLLFRPLPEMATLHTGPPRNTSLALAAGGVAQRIAVADGLHCHLKARVKLSAVASVVSFTFRAAATGRPTDAMGSTVLNISRGSVSMGPWKWGSLGSSPATLTNSSTVDLEVFVDGPLTEVFANGGERAGINSANVDTLAGDAVMVSAVGGAAAVEVTAWGMERVMPVMPGYE